MIYSARVSRLVYMSGLAVLACTCSSCTPASYSSQEGVTGGLLGVGTGALSGWLIGEQVGKKTENIALGSAIGGGLGMLGGAWINEQNIKLVRKRELVVREATLVGQQQRELDQLREQVYDSSSLGGNEVKPWDRRFWDEEPESPYQGKVHP